MFLNRSERARYIQNNTSRGKIPAAEFEPSRSVAGKVDIVVKGHSTTSKVKVYDPEAISGRSREGLQIGRAHV